jgi:hypothetical protein
LRGTGRTLGQEDRQEPTRDEQAHAFRLRDAGDVRLAVGVRDDSLGERVLPSGVALLLMLELLGQFGQTLLGGAVRDTGQGDTGLAIEGLPGQSRNGAVVSQEDSGRSGKAARSRYATHGGGPLR